MDNEIKGRPKIEAPSGIDLTPEPPKAVRISRRTSIAIISVVVLLLLAFAYGGYRRTLTNQAAARDASLPKNVAPATQAGNEFMQATPPGTAPLTASRPDELRPPGMPAATQLAPCGSDPKTGQPYRFNPITGQACDSPFPQDRVVIRQASPMPVSAPTPVAEETPEQRRVAAAYQQEQAAMLAPTSAHNSAISSTATTRSAPDEISQIEALSRSLTQRPQTAMTSATASQGIESDYDSQNAQSRKEAFAAGKNRQGDNYLRSTREAPLSRFEIKAGWEIPAVLEQSLNSDLPGELKALVTSNVYDTATGLYLLIPQGSRLVGRYDSHVTFGQNGVQVGWNRIIYPDASSIDLDNMSGLDSHGNAGLRDKVDHHYTRMIGFTVLTSLFTAAFEISQRNNQTALAYPSAGQTAAGAIGQEVAQTGAQITKRNLNIQPTIKVPAGYKFTVRVNRDILFEAPYVAASPTFGGPKGSGR